MFVKSIKNKELEPQQPLLIIGLNENNYYGISVASLWKLVIKIYPSVIKGLLSLVNTISGVHVYRLFVAWSTMLLLTIDMLVQGQTIKVRLS